MSIVFIPNRQPEREPPRPLVDPANKLILFWMHRCGSTTGQLWFFELAGWKERMKGKGASELAPQWFAEHEDIYQSVQDCYRDPQFLKIAVVRNPLHRAVSAFTVVTDSKSGSQWRAVSRSIESPDSERRLSFNEFIEFLKSQDLTTANYHWRMQTAQDWYGLGLQDVELVRLESLQADLDRVCRRLGKPAIPLRINSAMTKIDADTSKIDVTNLVRSDFARLFGVDRRGIIQFPHYSRFLTESAVARLAPLYARDIDVLGYTGQA